MFGYVRIYKPELKMAEYEQYEGVYCALCRQMGKRYGPPARLMLSYDFAFLALFRMAFQDDCPRFSKARCTCNPFKKCTFCGPSAHIDACADAAVILTYYKLRDNMADESFFASLPARLAYPFVAGMRRRAVRRRPDLEEAVRSCMTEQAALEQAGTASIDAAAEPFARLLRFLAAETARDDGERRVLERFGYCLGRWIYLIDAVDDMPEDRQKGRYNPYLLMDLPAPSEPGAAILESGDAPSEDGTDDISRRRTYAALTLNACTAECIAAYNLMDIRRFDGILRNVLEQGLPAVMKHVAAGMGYTKDKRDKQSRHNEWSDPE